MRVRAVTAVAVFVLLATGCSDSGRGTAPASSPSASAPPGDETETAAGNRWWLRTKPRPEDRTLDLFVQERACASGQPATGRIRHDVDYADDRVVVTITVANAKGDRSCQGNPDTAYTLPLAEPLGDRAVYDGRTTPPTRAQTTAVR